MAAGGISATALNVTGQRLDTTGLLYYHARYYHPVLGRFASADTIVPGNASGSVEGVAIKGLTVDFHEPGFVSSLSKEHQQDFWFRLSEDDKKQAGSPWGPANPQSLNRYSYVQNNPLNFTDASGHWTFQISGGASAFAVLGIRGEASFAFDGKGNMTLLLSGGGGVHAGVGASAGPSVTWTDAPTVADLKGFSALIGAQGGEAIGVSVDRVIFGQYRGWSVGGAAKLLALPIEVHINSEGTLAPFGIYHSDSMAKFWQDQSIPAKSTPRPQTPPVHYVCSQNNQGTSSGRPC